MVPKHVGVFLELPKITKITSPDTKSHARQVEEVIKIFLRNTDYPEGQNKFENLLTRFHDIIMLPGDPLDSTILVKYHIP